MTRTPEEVAKTLELVADRIEPLTRHKCVVPETILSDLYQVAEEVRQLRTADPCIELSPEYSEELLDPNNIEMDE